MTHGSNLLARVAHLIDTEVALMQRFIDLLSQEESLLIAGDTDALLILTREKTELYHQLQRQHDTRALLLGREGIANDDASMRRLCATLPDTMARWDKLLELAGVARAQNELNGKLIIERMQHNQAALSVLMSAGNQPQLYDAGGVARPTGRGRHLGSA